MSNKPNRGNTGARGPPASEIAFSLLLWQQRIVSHFGFTLTCQPSQQRDLILYYFRISVLYAFVIGIRLAIPKTIWLGARVTAAFGVCKFFQAWSFVRFLVYLTTQRARESSALLQKICKLLQLWA